MKEFWYFIHDNLGDISDVLGIIGAFFAFFAWVQSKRTNRKLEQEKIRLNKTIKVVLKDHVTKRHLELPVQLRRSELTRQELLGRIGMLNPKARFSIEYVGLGHFFEQLKRILESDNDDIFEIECTPTEFDQFVHPSQKEKQGVFASFERVLNRFIPIPESEKSEQ